MSVCQVYLLTSMHTGICSCTILLHKLKCCWWTQNWAV